MKKWIAVLMLFALPAWGANFYWKQTFVDLDAIAGKANGDRGLVIDNNGVLTHYYHTGGAWVAVAAIDNMVIGGTTPAVGTFTTVTASSYASNAADNAHFVGAGNTADPTGANLGAGRIWFNNTSNLLKVRNGDNTATLALNDVQWHRVNIDAPTVADNVVFAGPLERAQTIDNVLFLVQDNTGKLSGASTDNVTVNVSYCPNIATPTCTNVFTSDQVVTGAIVSAGAMNNTAPAAGDYLRVGISAANMTNKKLYIRIKYRSL